MVKRKSRVQPFICWVNKNCAVNAWKITASQFWRQKFKLKKAKIFRKFPSKTCEAEIFPHLQLKQLQQALQRTSKLKHWKTMKLTKLLWWTWTFQTCRKNQNNFEQSCYKCLEKTTLPTEEMNASILIWLSNMTLWFDLPSSKGSISSTAIKTIQRLLLLWIVSKPNQKDLWLGNFFWWS